MHKRPGSLVNLDTGEIDPDDIDEVFDVILTEPYAQQFYSAMRECVRRGKMSAANKDRLARWCHPKNGDQAAQEFAQSLSKLLFGYVLDRND